MGQAPGPITRRRPGGVPIAPRAAQSSPGAPGSALTGVKQSQRKTKCRFAARRRSNLVGFALERRPAAKVFGGLAAANRLDCYCPNRLRVKASATQNDTTA